MAIDKVLRGIPFLRQELTKIFMKRAANKSGIMTVPFKNKKLQLDIEDRLQKYILDAQKQGVDLDMVSNENLKYTIKLNENVGPVSRAISADSAEGRAITEKLFGKKGEVVDMTGKNIDTSQGIMGGKSVKELMDSGQVQKGTDGLKKNDNVLKRELFNNSNLNETDAQIKARLEAGNNKSIDSIKKKNRDSMPIRLMKNFEDELNEADLIAEGYSKDQANVLIRARKKMTSGEEMNPNESLLRVKEEFADNAGVDVEDFTDIDFEIEIPDYAKGGRAGFYTGGITDVEPSLDDIGHGADAMNARTRLMSPGSQATTSTGLNYLLAEDNDNMRIPFAGGGDPKRRAFLKLLASLTGGAAAFKTGILGLGEGGAKKAVTETVKQAAGSGGQVPPYFLNLVKKIKTLGDDTLATKDKAIAKKYKDYTMEEDFAGNIEIIKKERGGFREDVYMSYKVDDVPVKGKKGSTKVEEYEEFTARPDQEGKMKNVEQGVPDEVVQEGTIFEDTLSEFGKADGGRIGFSAGKTVLSKLGINSTSRRFLEKVFGKEGFETMIENDPRMHKGMLEVVEMFRNRDKEGLKMYLQKFLPDMGDAEIEKFIVGDSGTEGISGQLIRLGSGREYENLIKMSKEADQIRKLDDFDIDGVSKNAEGGRIGLFLGGPLVKNQLTQGKSLLKNMLKFLSKNGSHKKSPAEILQMYNPKQFNKLLNNPKNTGKISPATGETADQMIKDTMSKTQNERADMVGGIIDTSRKIKVTDDEIIAYKIKMIKDMIAGGIDEKTARSFAEQMGEQMVRAAGKKSPPKITEQGLLELENIQKNLLTKDRKLQATGGLTTMLGE